MSAILHGGHGFRMRGHMKRKISLRKRQIIFAWMCVLPVLFIRGWTTIYPVLKMFYYSFLDYDLIRRTKQFAGFANFRKLAKNQQFLESLSFTVKFTGISMCAIIVLGIALALLLKQEFRGRKLIRTIALIPWGLSTIVVSIAALWAFDDSYGIINDMIRRIGFSGYHFTWLADKTGAQVAVILVNIWKNVSFFAVIMLAAFQGVPAELFESAKIDGAGNWKILTRVTMPYVMRTFIMMIIFVGVSQINSFEIVYAMTKGGPGTTTSLLAYRLYMEATKNMNYGMASAITMVMFLVTAVYGLIGLKLYRKVDY